MSPSNRRQFLQVAGAAAAAAAVPYHFSASRAFAATDRPILGCIGTGSRWGAVGPEAMNFADCVAVCDVDAKHAEDGAARVKSKQGKSPEVFEDYRKLLERKDIDVVTIVTPDHWHTKIAIEAMKAGKDVYCEKPLTLTIDEGKQIIKVLKETKRVFQVGTQQRSEMSANKGKVPQQFLVAVAICHAGKLGKLKKVTCAIGAAPTSPKLPKVDVPKELNWDMWLGQAPLTDYLEGPSEKPKKGDPQSRCHYEFRWWLEYSGGKMTDWGAHHVDIASWAIGATDTGPLVISPDMSKTKFPVAMKNGMPTESDQYNAATEFLVACKYASGVVLEIRHDTENGITIEGEKGKLFVSRGALRCEPEGLMEELPSAEEITKLYKGKKPGNHMGNFFECVQTREDPISDVYTHHRAMSTCHLANIATRLGREIKWDPAQEAVVGDDEANGFLKREQRKGYEITT